MQTGKLTDCTPGQPTAWRTTTSGICFHPIQAHLLVQHRQGNDVHGAGEQDAGALDAQHGLWSRRPHSPRPLHGCGCRRAAGVAACCIFGGLGLLRALLRSLRCRCSIICCLGWHAGFRPAGRAKEGAMLGAKVGAAAVGGGSGPSPSGSRQGGGRPPGYYQSWLRVLIAPAL